jgi:glycosyltransferase involved in cell wall biosynthesis
MYPSILIIQERGRHEKNREFRECENFKRAFNKLGVKCDIWGLGYENFSIPFSQVAKDYNVIFVLENYDETGWVPELSSYKQLKMHWTIDCHCGGIPRYLTFSKKSKINIHLNSSEQYIQYFIGACDKAYWFPNAYPDDVITHKPEIQKSVDIGFCGSMIADRPQWTSLLEKKYGRRFKKDIFVIGQDMVDAVNSYKICINKSIADDLNYRTFETLGTKTFLITNSVPNINRIFKDGEHCIFYQSTEEMMSKIDYYLEHPREVEKIASAGYDHVITKHTYFERAKLLIEIIKKNI